MTSPSLTSTAPTGTSPKAAPCAASASASRMKCSSRERSMIGILLIRFPCCSYHLDRRHQPGFHVIDHMTVEHPHAGIIRHQGDAGGFVLAQQVGVGVPGLDLATVGRDHLEGHAVQVDRMLVLAEVAQLEDVVPVL